MSVQEILASGKARVLDAAAANNDDDDDDEITETNVPASLPRAADHRHLLERNFTVRFRCLLDNTSGFLVSFPLLFALDFVGARESVSSVPIWVIFCCASGQVKQPAGRAADWRNSVVDHPQCALTIPIFSPD